MVKWISISVEHWRPLWVLFLLNEPFFLWFVDGFRVVGADDGSVRGLARRLAAAFGFVGVVGAFVTEHVADEEHQGAQDGEDHHRDDACRESIVTESKLWHRLHVNEHEREKLFPLQI